MPSSKYNSHTLVEVPDFRLSLYSGDPSLRFPTYLASRLTLPTALLSTLISKTLSSISLTMCRSLSNSEHCSLCYLWKPKLLQC